MFNEPRRATYPFVAGAWPQHSTNDDACLHHPCLHHTWDPAFVQDPILMVIDGELRRLSPGSCNVYTFPNVMFQNAIRTEYLAGTQLVMLRYQGPPRAADETWER